MVHVRSAVSGERLGSLSGLVSAKALKRYLAPSLGCSRFRQRFYCEDVEIQDDHLLEDEEVTLVLLDFWPPDIEQDRKLIEASMKGNAAEVEGLLERPQNPQVTDSSGVTPLHYVALQGHYLCLRLLLEAGAKTDVRETSSGFGFTALHLAAQAASEEVVALLIDARASQGERCSHGMVPLQYACLQGQAKAVEVLLKSDIELDRCGRHRPMFLAASHGHTEVARSLIEMRADCDDTTWRSSLFAGVRKGHVEVVRLLLHAVSDSMALVEDMMLLHVAAESGHVEVLRLLLEHRADSNQTTVVGMTPLHLAAREGHLEVGRALLENRAEIEMPSEGATPLQLSAQGGHSEFVRLLIGGKEAQGRH
eukprot:Skav213442  [mRNA]  locus=scaffold837:172472:173566:+ [translate_table: standard]